MSRAEQREALLEAAAQDRLDAAVRAWIEAELPAGWTEALAGDGAALRALRAELDERVWARSLAEVGLAAPTWPVEHGGLNLTRAQAGVVARALRASKAPRSRNPIGLNMVAPALLRWGTEEQRRRFLPGIADQTEVWCQLFSEPGTGSDLASLATRARPDGDRWRVTGQKMWTSLAHRVRWGLLLARTDPDVPKHEGISVFAVDMTAPGVTVVPLRQITGDAEFNEVFLDDVEVPDAHRLGETGEGWPPARAVLAHERVSDSGGGVQPGVIAGRGVDELVRRFAPVAGATLRERLVRAWLEEQTLALTTMDRARHARHSAGPGVDPAVTKMISTAHSQALQDLAVGFGGINAVAWEPEDRWSAGTGWSWLRVQAKTIAGGTADITRNLCGERFLGLDREPSADRGRPWSEVPRSGWPPDRPTRRRSRDGRSRRPRRRTAARPPRTGGGRDAQPTPPDERPGRGPAPPAARHLARARRGPGRPGRRDHCGGRARLLHRDGPRGELPPRRGPTAERHGHGRPRRRQGVPAAQQLPAADGGGRQRGCARARACTSWPTPTW